MEEFWKEVRLAALLGFVLPAFVMGLGTWAAGSSEQMPVQTEPEGKQEVFIPVLDTDGDIRQMELESYLTGVVLGEMPADFEEEALKAQSVVARTYTVRAWERGKKHTDAAVCMEASCCQAYRSEENYLSMGGTEADLEKIRKAVSDTRDQVLTYDGELIEATYFSCSGGSTEDAAVVWGTDVPYLQAVESPGEEGAAHFEDTAEFTPREFAELLGLPLSGDPKNWFGAVTYSDGGGVETMVIGGVTFKGTTLRKSLGLRSTVFTVDAGQEKITLTTRGFGHRVGMSQYGADAMALNGSDYRQILSHYYRGTELTQWNH